MLKYLPDISIAFSAQNEASKLFLSEAVDLALLLKTCPDVSLSFTARSYISNNSDEEIFENMEKVENAGIFYFSHNVLDLIFGPRLILSSEKAFEFD